MTGTYNAAIYTKQGGDVQIVGNGGTLEVESGGTLKLDAGALVDWDAALTVGQDDTGYDVKFFGATSGAFWLWDESADTVVRDGGSVFAQAVASGDGGITVSADGMTANPETAQEAGYITFKVGATSYQVPMYAA